MAARWKAVIAFIAGAIPLITWWYALAEGPSGIEFGSGGVSMPMRVSASLYGNLLGIMVVTVPLWRVTANALWPNEKHPILVRLAAITDKQWIAFCAFTAFALGAVARVYVLRFSPLTDDEGAYQYGARLLLDGRLSVPSREPRLFFDNFFLINDGKMYPQYPMGWPALIAVALPVHLESFLNPLVSAATVPAIYGVAKALRGETAGKLATLLFIASPMLAIGAGTMMSHTSALCATSWVLWVAYTRSTNPSPKWDAAIAFFLGAAVFIRPTVGISFSLVVGTWWLWTRIVRDTSNRARRLIAFAIVAGVLGALFLAINAAQTGSPFKLAYQRSLEYVQSNGFRFSPWNKPGEFMQAGHLGDWFVVALGALLRINADLFYVPIGLVPLAFIRWNPTSRLIAVTSGVYFFVHCFAKDVGVDTFAPVHFFELSGPLLVLGAVGLLDARERISRRLVSQVCVVVAAIGLVTMIPMRVLEIHELAHDANAPYATVDDAGLTKAVVFYVGPPLQCRKFSKHFVWGRPYGQPDFGGDVVWVNHLEVGMDRKLMADMFPDRTGYLLMMRSDCTMGLAELNSDDAKFALPSTNLKPKTGHE